MPRSKEEQIAWEKQAYGCTWDDFTEVCDIRWDDYFEVMNLSVSIQSDVQELVNMNCKESARQAINRSKRCIIIAKELIRKDPNGSELRKLGY